MSLKISVVICTRDRHDLIGAALESVLGCSYRPFDVHVMDQSRSNETRVVVEGLMDRSGPGRELHYHHLDKAGLSRAYNAGMRVSDGEIIACTDDDVLVPPDWLSSIARAFESDEDAGLLYGQVCLPRELEERAKQGVIIPTLTWPTRERLSRAQGNYKVWGMGANMAIRRSLLDRVGGFDEAMGGGGPLRSSQDYDFAYRTYRSGLAILLEPEVKVDHYGTRNAEDWPLTLRNYGIGDAAFYSKHARCGDPLAIRLFLMKLLHTSLAPFAAWVRGRGWAGPSAYTRGFYEGLKTAAGYSIEPEYRLYRSRSGAAMAVTEANVVTSTEATAKRPSKDADSSP
jgi:GT2 family glycosyltransferase